VTTGARELRMMTTLMPLGSVARVTAFSAEATAGCPMAAEAPIKNSNFKRYLGFKSIISKRKENACKTGARVRLSLPSLARYGEC